MKILVVRQDKLGDCLLATGLLASLSKAIPEVELTVVCQPGMKGIFERTGLKHKIQTLPYKLGFPGLISTGLSWRKKKYDVVLLPKQNSGDYAIASLVAGIPRRVGLTSKWHKLFLTHNLLDKLDPALHEVRIMLRMAEDAISRSLPEVPLCYNPTQKEEDSAASQVDGLGPYFVICPLTGGTSAQWPAENFRQLGRKLSQEFGLIALIAAGPDQVEESAKAGDFPGAVLLAGQAGLGEFAAIFRGAALVISVNSGLIHLAASQKAPVCVIETREDHLTAAARWSPWQTEYLTVSPTPDQPTVEDVYRAAKRLLTKRATGDE